MAHRCYRETILEPNPRQAVRRIVEGVGTDSPALVCVFVDAQYDLDGLAAELCRQVRGPVLACTTAGHVTSEAGIVDEGMTAMALDTDELHVAIEPMHEVSRFGIAEAKAVAGRLGLDGAPPLGKGSRFEIILIDGMSFAEERVTALLHGASNGLPMVGGSAGDGQRFEKTYIFDGKRFVSNAAVLARVDTGLAHHTYGYQYFKPRAKRMVVTRAVTEKRQILELDGEIAPLAYQEAIGQKELNSQIVSHHPLLLRWDGCDYARAIRAWDHDRLDMFCAVEEGMVVRIGEPEDLVAMTEAQLKKSAAELGGEMLVFMTFACYQRRLAIERLHDQERYRRVIASYPFVGFSTYGEQYNGLHGNHMATGFVLGTGASKHHGN